MHKFQNEEVLLDKFILFFRQTYRLCWKEIYLKILAITYFKHTEQCENCHEHFQMVSMASCKESLNGFHLPMISHSLNMLTTLQYFQLQLETQVIDNDLSDIEMKKLIKSNGTEYEFIEP
jgi:hypothetical protein